MLDTWNNLLSGFATAGTPINLLWAFVGCVLGTAIGVLPGLGPAVTVAMLLPITAQVEPTASMIFFAGIYYGAMYGGSTTSILLNTPGETGTMVTALEGFKMAKNGRAGSALATAAIGSFVAGTLATILVIFKDEIFCRTTTFQRVLCSSGPVLSIWSISMASLCVSRVWAVL